jgi:hypothetical protein
VSDPIDFDSVGAIPGTVAPRSFDERRRGDRRKTPRTDLPLSAAPNGLPETERLWHVTVTVAGPAVDREEVRVGLERLGLDHPFLMSGRYSAERAEVRYWEEAPDVHDALAMALRLWGEHRITAGLPKWSIVGLEVLDRETYRTRDNSSALVSPGVRPF